MKQAGKYTSYLINLIFPALVFGSVAGALTAVVVVLYKVCAHHAIAFAETGYHYLSGHAYLLPVVAVGLFGVAWVLDWLYTAVPNLRGGGIPTSIAVLRGLLPFRWLRNLVGIFGLSLATFAMGVPLGNEGPAVQMGTAIGRSVVAPFAKKHGAWGRYSMTGGACAGFSVATGAPISGILFGIEEAHQRISPMIIIVSATAVLFSHLTTQLLAPLFGVSTTLFPAMELPALGVGEVWIPLVVGVAMGLFAVAFLQYYRLISGFFSRTLRRMHSRYKLFLVLVAVLVLGTLSFSFVSTGHELILTLFEGNTAVWLLLLILVLRSTGTLCANTNGITGGIFLPMLALGAVLASLLGKGLDSLFGLSPAQYTLVLVLGITACISGMMKMPLTAIIFAVEALSCHENVIYVVLVATVSFAITELFDVKSINDSVLDSRLEKLNEGKTTRVIDTFVTVQKGAFAVGKQIRDIFWPANLFVLSLKHSPDRSAEVNQHGEKAIAEGDVLHVRYLTYDEAQTKEELMAIVGAQDYAEQEDDVI
ncbi:MAG: chloride channel protein [Clostridia bacterium]|nr:chloride channel protein [Clostridia bacterium]